MPPQELTFGDWDSDTASSTDVDIQGDTFTLAEAASAIPDSVVDIASLDNGETPTTVNLGSPYNGRQIVAAVAQFNTYPVTAPSIGGNTMSQVDSVEVSGDGGIAVFRYVDNGNLGDTATYDASDKSVAGSRLLSTVSTPELVDSSSGADLAGDSEGFQFYAHQLANGSGVSQLTDWGNVESIDANSDEWFISGFNEAPTETVSVPTSPGGGSRRKTIAVTLK
jgi:hypothetical protein